MKYLLVSLILLSLTLSSNTQAQGAELSRECSTETTNTNIFADNILFFTMPSLDEDPQLELWQAQANHISFTGLSFSPFTIFQTNPSGSSIVAVVTHGDYYLPGDTVFEHTGSEIREIIHIDTERFTTTSISLPEEFADKRFLRRIQWIDDDRILLLSPDWYLLFILNLATSELETVDLLEFDLQPYVVYPGGTMIPSPSGEYLLYTTVDPSLPLVGANEEQVFAWHIMGIEGDFSLAYVSGIGGSARWMSDDTIVLRTLENDIAGINILDGEETLIYQSSGEILLTQMLPSPDASMIALTRWLDRAEADDFQQYSLVIINTEDAVAYDTCLSWIQLKKEAWSSDSRFLAYVAIDRETTNIHVLDVDSNEYTQVLPRQPLNDSIGSRFIRVVGWK